MLWSYKQTSTMYVGGLCGDVRHPLRTLKNGEVYCGCSAALCNCTLDMEEWSDSMYSAIQVACPKTLIVQTLPSLHELHPKPLIWIWDLRSEIQGRHGVYCVQCVEVNPFVNKGLSVSRQSVHYLPSNCDPGKNRNHDRWAWLNIRSGRPGSYEYV